MNIETEYLVSGTSSIHHLNAYRMLMNKWVARANIMSGHTFDIKESFANINHEPYENQKAIFEELFKLRSMKVGNKVLRYTIVLSKKGISLISVSVILNIGDDKSYDEAIALINKTWLDFIAFIIDFGVMDIIQKQTNAEQQRSGQGTPMGSIMPSVG
jgi:hypothetical protein